MSEEYNKLFTKFYSDYFKFKSGKKSHLKCPGCQSEKRFIFSDNKLIYSCGPSNDPKCGKQYTIQLPEYIDYRILCELYEKNINGSFDYDKKNILQYNLNEFKHKMNVENEYQKQNKLIKESSEDLKRLIDDYIQINQLDEYIDNLKNLSELRYKNNIEKQKIMRSLKEDELSEPEKLDLRRKYAACIKENNQFIEIIKKLNQPENNFIMTKDPENIIHKKESKTKESKTEESKTEESKTKRPKTKESKTKKSKCSKAHPSPPCPEGKEVPEGKNCCYNEKKKKKSESVSESKSKSEQEHKTKEDSVESPKKYTYEEQIEILIEYYSKVDPKKTENDIKRIINNRRPKDSPKETRIPTKPWLELCEKLNQKYNVHPLKIK